MYYVKPQNEFISLNELNKDREKYYKLQQKDNDSIIFCNCNDTNIPMILTAHTPTHHFQTKHRYDSSKHYKFCPHYANGSDKNKYEPAITKDDDGNEIANVDFKNSDREINDKIEYDYIVKNEFIHNNKKRSVYKSKMSFDAFVKYKNMSYFSINQYKKQIYNLQEFNQNLKSYINYSIVNGKKLKDLNKGYFIYNKVNKIELNKHGNYFYVYYESDKKYSIKTEILNNAIQNFENTYNGLNIKRVLERNDCFIIIYGFKNINKTKYPKYENISFLLVNNYGLFSESIYEVQMYNMICNHILHKNSKYVFYKPTNPENDYDNPNFISDGIIRKRKSKEKIVVEVFGRNDQEYSIRKDEKIKTCKHVKLFWDIYDNNSFDECKRIVKNL